MSPNKGSFFLQIERRIEMKLFFTREEKQEFKRLRRTEKSNTRRMTDEELRKIEDAERFIDYRRDFLFSILSLCISILSIIIVLVSRL